MLIRLLFLVFVCIHYVANAQQEINDAALWTSIALKKKVNEKVDWHLNQKNRFNENFTELGRFSIGTAVTYHLNNAFSIKAGYTIIARKRLENDYSIRHRLNFALQAKKEIGRWNFKYRLLLQARYKNVQSSKNGYIPDWVLRNKLSIEYFLTKQLTMYGAEELYYPLYQAQVQGFSRSRTYLGALYKLSRNNELEFYFMLQNQLYTTEIATRLFVYGIGFEHKF